MLNVPFQICTTWRNSFRVQASVLSNSNINVDLHTCNRLIFFKIWAKPGLFLLIFDLFSIQWQIYSTIENKWKKHGWCAWDSNPRRPSLLIILAADPSIANPVSHFNSTLMRIFSHWCPFQSVSIQSTLNDKTHFELQWGSLVEKVKKRIRLRIGRRWSRVEVNLRKCKFEKEVKKIK